MYTGFNRWSIALCSSVCYVLHAPLQTAVFLTTSGTWTGDGVQSRAMGSRSDDVITSHLVLLRYIDKAVVRIFPEKRALRHTWIVKWWEPGLEIHRSLTSRFNPAASGWGLSGAVLPPCRVTEFNTRPPTYTTRGKRRRFPVYSFRVFAGYWCGGRGATPSWVVDRTVCLTLLSGVVSSRVCRLINCFLPSYTMAGSPSWLVATGSVNNTSVTSINSWICSRNLLSPV